MAREIRMPRLGESITEGTIIRWFKKPGDSVERDEALFEVSTDKVDTEIPAPSAGVIESILVGEGETVDVDTLVCLLAESTATGTSSALPSEPGRAPVVPAAAPGAGPRDEVASTVDDAREPHRYSPAVRRLIQEHGLALDDMTGSGEGGRITKRDVEARIASLSSAPAPTAAAAAPHAAATHAAGDVVEAMSAMRRQIAEHMVRSRRTSAHVSTIHEVDMTETRRARDKLRAAGTKVTYLPFVAQAVARALREHRWLNASLEDDKVRFHACVHLGFAVALPDGLLVPVVRDADKLSVARLSDAIHDLAHRARQKSLKPDEVRGGTFTITNAGVFGTLIGMPIIAQPQAGILCLGSVNKRVVVVDEESETIGIRSMSFLSLSFDHRIADGATADAFMSAVRRRLESGEFE